MTHATKNYLRQHWMTLANLILLLTIFFRAGAIMTAMQKDIEANKSNQIEHKESESVHMTFEKEAAVFVPRIELDSRLENIEKQLDRIEKKLDK